VLTNCESRVRVEFVLFFAAVAAPAGSRYLFITANKKLTKKVIAWLDVTVERAVDQVWLSQKSRRCVGASTCRPACRQVFRISVVRAIVQRSIDTLVVSAARGVSPHEPVNENNVFPVLSRCERLRHSVAWGRCTGRIYRRYAMLDMRSTTNSVSSGVSPPYWPCDLLTPGSRQEQLWRPSDDWITPEALSDLGLSLQFRAGLFNIHWNLFRFQILS